MRSLATSLLVSLGLLCLDGATLAHAADEVKPATQPATSQPANNLKSDLRDMSRRGARFLLATQASDGGWGPQYRVGVSALALRALVQEPSVGPADPAVRRGVAFILEAQQPDGGVYSGDGLQKNYESSVVLSLLSALHDPSHADAIKRLQRFLTDNQWDEGEGKPRTDVFYGGAGYGHGKRPDLSNTQMMLEALHDSGLPASDPAYQKALVFIQRCQMLGETNDQPFAKGSTQGGFIYSPANGGESKAETVDIDGRQELRCYGTMTYAGFKSMLYAGLSRDDQRVKAALGWIQGNWTLTANPNMPEKQSQEGLFYYYHVFARALAAWGQDTITDSVGREHRWREELVTRLRRIQQEDGSWVNEQDRWMEGLPELTTAYAMLALQAAR